MESKEQYPKATETILESTYTDDSTDSSPSDEECLDLYDQLSKNCGGQPVCTQGNGF